MDGIGRDESGTETEGNAGAVTEMRRSGVPKITSLMSLCLSEKINLQVISTRKDGA